MLKISKYWWVVVALLLAVGVQGVYSAATTGQTTDETFFSASGYPIVRYNNYEFLGEHPPLIMQLGALPLLVLQPRYPIRDPLYVPGTDRLDLSKNGARFLYKMGNDPQRILFLERLPVVGLTVLLGLMLFLFAGGAFRGMGGPIVPDPLLFFAGHSRPRQPVYDRPRFGGVLFFLRLCAETFF